ncbi:imidazoleglycerol-phosphate dehydratase [Bacillus litorisediminis]|uniref:imidazoleglycerol-phosphate dehydratase n=1 Tax=Bacillus litorisediminis TaxID=2922713 RepID=UPI001FAB8852|nr:imidazoleglycerol-phosphate dehydratase [Bacillus litorisediminis]
MLLLTKRDNRHGSKNQSSPRNSGKLDTEFGQEAASGDNSKGKHYNSNRGSKSHLKNPNNH